MNGRFFLVLFFCMIFPALACGATYIETATVNGIKWEYTVTNGKASIYSISTSPSGAITIPSSLGGYPVTRIGGSAFHDCYSLTSVTIPTSVTSIGDSAFYRCSGLTSIPIPDGVTNIEDSTFSWCSGLKSVTIPNGVTNIGYYAFYECSSLVSVIIPDSVTSIGERAFGDCRGLVSLTLPDSVTSIGKYAFDRCFNLSDTIIRLTDMATWATNSISSYLPHLGESMHLFLNGEEITHFEIPTGVTRIQNYAFEGCSGLMSVTIPDSVKSIGDRAFFGCSGLESVTIPAGVTNIGYNAFASCSGLESVTIPDSVTSIGRGAFYNCENLYDTTTIPGILLVDGWVIGCESGLSGSLDLTGIRGIAPSAFRNCLGLKSVTISDNVPNIDENTFLGCTELKTIHYHPIACKNPPPSTQKVQ